MSVTQVCERKTIIFSEETFVKVLKTQKVTLILLRYSIKNTYLMGTINVRHKYF